jgi:hypothetical protein
VPFTERGFVKKSLLVSVLPVVFLFASEFDSKLVKEYKAGKYKSVCKKGMHAYYKGRKDEHFAALVGVACANNDSINFLGILQRNLVGSPSMRSTASYFSALLLQKRLIYQFMIDGIDLSGFRLPKYDHVLSVVFDKLSKGDYKSLGGVTNMIKIDEGERTIFISISDDKPARVLVDEYKDAKLLKRHWYQ